MQFVLARKKEMVDDPEEMLLSKLPEVISKCSHRDKCKLKALASNKKDRGIT